MENKFIDISLYSDWLVHHFNLNGLDISPLKLQKILYYTQAWGLAFINDQFFEEAPEAWSNGPVYRSIWEKYKSKYQRHEHIGFPIDYDLESNYRSTFQGLNLSELQKKVVTSILNKYAGYTSEHLVYLTHAELPWNEARKDCTPFELCKIPINLEVMKSYYKSLLEKSNK